MYYCDNYKWLVESTNTKKETINKIVPPYIIDQGNNRATNKNYFLVRISELGNKFHMLGSIYNATPFFYKSNCMGH